MKRERKFRPTNINQNNDNSPITSRVQSTSSTIPPQKPPIFVPKRKPTSKRGGRKRKAKKHQFCHRKNSKKKFFGKQHQSQSTPKRLETDQIQKIQIINKEPEKEMKKKNRNCDQN